MRAYMEFVDDVLHDFGGDLSKDDIYHMTYKEIGYMRKHRRKHYPIESEQLARALVGLGGGHTAPVDKGPHPAHVPPVATVPSSTSN